MSKPNLEDYVTVNTRIGIFHGQYEQGAIRARKVLDDGKRVQFEACVHRGGEACELDERGRCLNACATGTAEEIRGDGFINKTSAVENCETSAVGRALAVVGIEVSKSVASREEVAQALARGERQDEAEKSAPKSNGKPIGIARARELVDRAMIVVDLDRLRLAATHIAGDDIGTCESEDGAVLALQKFSPEQAKRLAEWVAKKAAEAKA